MFEFLMLLSFAAAVFCQLLPPNPKIEKENRRQKRRLGAVYRLWMNRISAAGGCRRPLSNGRKPLPAVALERRLLRWRRYSGFDRAAGDAS